MQFQQIESTLRRLTYDRLLEYLYIIDRSMHSFACDEECRLGALSRQAPHMHPTKRKAPRVVDKANFNNKLLGIISVQSLHNFHFGPFHKIGKEHRCGSRRVLQLP
jgi:hypothetical protein